MAGGGFTLTPTAGRGAAELAAHRVMVRWLLDRCGILRSPVTACTGRPPGDRPRGAACEEPAERDPGVAEQGEEAARERGLGDRRAAFQHSLRGRCWCMRLLACHDAGPSRCGRRTAAVHRPPWRRLSRTESRRCGRRCSEVTVVRRTTEELPLAGSTDAVWAWQEKEHARPGFLAASAVAMSRRPCEERPDAARRSGPAGTPSCRRCWPGCVQDRSGHP
jgi:hypothetical protein